MGNSVYRAPGNGLERVPGHIHWMSWDRDKKHKGLTDYTHVVLRCCDWTGSPFPTGVENIKAILNEWKRDHLGREI